ncbi:hypothetical protein [Nocardia farcinica]|uniref:hypothetical protein n=1 Tax=Nocardia farcinica TaxID=37329 RepID=UPI0024572739|nr:hypothetical protein [Nocardia farcinica]
MDSLFDGARYLIRLGRPLSLKDRVIQAALTGTELKLADVRPNVPTDVNRVPGGLVHDILSGKYGSLHHRGLRLNGLYIDGSIDLSYLEWSGQLALKNCYIDGDFNLERARVTGDVQLDGTWTRWVNARSANIDGSLALRFDFRSERGLYAIGIKITGGLYMQRSTFIGPEDVTYRMAIELFRSSIGDLFLSGSKVVGGMYASGIIVERNARMQGTVFSCRKSLGWSHTGTDYKGALSLANCEIKGTLYLHTVALPQFSADGTVSLRGATCRQIYIHKDIFARHTFEVDNFNYDRLHGISAREWLDVLEKSDIFPPRAYLQLAKYCTSIGDLSTRRRTLMRLEKRLTKQLPWWSQMRFARWLHGALVGYGYSAWRAVVWLTCVVVGAASLLHWGDVFALKSAPGQPANSAETLGWSDSFRVVVDSFLPFAPLGMKDSWVAVPTNGGQWAWMAGFMSLRLVAWALAALALLSFTNVVRNPRT